MQWTNNDPYTYKSGYWTIIIVIDKGIPKWGIFNGHDIVATRKNLSKAKDYAEKQEVKNG